MRKRMDNWNILFIVLIFIGSVGGVLFSIKQIYNAQDDKKDIINNLKSNAVELKERNEDLNNQLDNLKIANENLSAELKSLSTKNQTLSDKLSKTSLELNKSIMGDGYSLLV